MSNHLVYDNFGDIFAFRAAITSRPRNSVKGNAAENSGEDFAGMPLNDAFEALTDGLPEVASALKRDMQKFKAEITGTLTQRRPINYYNGSSPNVPAAIIGLPKSMRKVTCTPSKVKTVELFYDNTANAGTSSDTLNKSGSCVFQLVYWLELNGYRVRFTVCPFLAEEGHENAVCSILLKDFRQPLDILKLSFSITSVSMFRRLGFRWLETVPNLEHDWSHTYGRHIDDKKTAMEVLKRTGQRTENGYFITIKDCEAVNFDPVKLANSLGIKAGN